MGKAERSAGAVIGCCPQTSVMSLDDGAAHRQADSHSILLCRIESVEQPLCGIGSEPDPRVCHAETHLIILIHFGLDQQLSGRSSIPVIASEAFRIRFSMTCCTWTRSPLTGARFSASSQRRTTRFLCRLLSEQCNDFAHGLVQVQRRQREFLFAEQARNRVITSDARLPSRRFAELFHGRRRCSEDHHPASEDMCPRW